MRQHSVLVRDRKIQGSSGSSPGCTATEFSDKHTTVLSARQDPI